MMQAVMRGAVPLDVIEAEDFKDAVKELQSLLSHASHVLDLIRYDEIEEQHRRSVARLAAIALEREAWGIANDTSLTADRLSTYGSKAELTAQNCAAAPSWFLWPR